MMKECIMGMDEMHEAVKKITESVIPDVRQLWKILYDHGSYGAADRVWEAYQSLEKIHKYVS